MLGQERLILFGGYYCPPDGEHEFHYNDTYALSLDTMIWHRLTLEPDQSPDERFAAASGFEQKNLYLFGGVKKEGWGHSIMYLI